MENYTVIIYGAGDYGKEMYRFLEKTGCKADYFCQTITEKDKACLGVPVISVQQLSEIISPKIVLIAVADRLTVHSIKTALYSISGNLTEIYDCSQFIENIKYFSENKILYQGYDFEKNAMLNYWEPYFKNEIKLEKCKKHLLNGLDNKEKKEAETIIERMRNLIYQKPFNADIFSEEEKKEISETEREFYLKIHKDNAEDNVWKWKNYKLDSRNFEACVFFNRCGVGQLKNLDKLKNKCILDIGAYIGDSAVILSEYTDNTVYAFEAFEENYSRIQINSSLNNRKNIVPVNYALGDKEDEITFYLRANGETGHGGVKRSGLEYKNSITVKSITVDRFIETNQLEVGLIKADIEGMEQAMLRGAMKTICTQKPALLISIYHTADDFFEIKRMIDELNLGYKFSVYHPISKNSIISETLLICEVR